MVLTVLAQNVGGQASINESGVVPDRATQLVGGTTTVAKTGTTILIGALDWVGIKIRRNGDKRRFGRDRGSRVLERPGSGARPAQELRASESSLQAIVRVGTSSRSRYAGLGTEGTRGDPPRSHRPIQVRRTQAS